MSHPRLAVLVLSAAAFAALAGSAGAVVPKVLYGKPGNVQIAKAEGTRVSASQYPTIKFPTHTIRRSALAPRDRQKICTTFKILVPATAPATGWVVSTSSGGHCGWVKPGYYQRINDWIWTGAFGVQYHVQYDVLWSTKKRKKLAAATYDFNTTGDYKCRSLYCLVFQGSDSVPYITFFG